MDTRQEQKELLKRDLAEAENAYEQINAEMKRKGMDERTNEDNCIYQNAWVLCRELKRFTEMLEQDSTIEYCTARKKILKLQDECEYLWSRCDSKTCPRMIAFKARMGAPIYERCNYHRFATYKEAFRAYQEENPSCLHIGEGFVKWLMAESTQPTKCHNVHD